MARNPLRSEAEAFRLVLLTVAYFALIVAAAVIHRWVGVAVFVLLTGLAALALDARRRAPSRRSGRASPHRGGEDERRILVVANETVGGKELLDVLRQQGGGRA